MEDFFNVLIVLITLIGFAISAISKNNKKKRTAQQGAQKNNFFESIFEDSQNADYITNEVAEEDPQTEPEIETIKEEKDEKIAKDKPLEYYSGDEGQSVLVNDEDNEIYLHEIKDDIQDSDYDNESEEVIEDFELRDAVIYSEILNRKNY